MKSCTRSGYLKHWALRTGGKRGTRSVSGCPSLHQKDTFHSKSRTPQLGNTLMVQWLGLRAFTPEGPGLIPGRGTKIPQATQHGQKEKKKRKKEEESPSLNSSTFQNVKSPRS